MKLGNIGTIFRGRGVTFWIVFIYLEIYEIRGIYESTPFLCHFPSTIYQVIYTNIKTFFPEMLMKYTNKSK